VKPKSDETRPVDKIPQHLICRCCLQRVTENRVYFGVVGPFCDVECRDAYARGDCEDEP
jgi:hypothetical protein